MLVLDGADGVLMDQVNKLPRPDVPDLNVATYKLCMCWPSGRVFAVPAPYTCDKASETENPCL